FAWRRLGGASAFLAAGQADSADADRIGSGPARRLVRLWTNLADLHGQSLVERADLRGIRAWRSGLLLAGRTTDPLGPLDRTFRGPAPQCRGKRACGAGRG